MIQAEILAHTSLIFKKQDQNVPLIFPAVSEIVRAFMDVSALADGALPDSLWLKRIAQILIEPDDFARPIITATFAPTSTRMYLRDLATVVTLLPASFTVREDIVNR